MSSRHPVCILCHSILSFGTGPTAWMAEFRAVRCEEWVPFLTGVGVFIRSGEPLTAPCDENKRYDDYGFRASERDSFSPMIDSHVDPGTGYVVHESCWELFRALLYPLPVPVQALYNVCRSCPIPSPGCLDLCLDYHGNSIKVSGLPNSRQFFQEVGRLTTRFGGSNAGIPSNKCDPFHIPEMQRLLDETQQPAPPEDTMSNVSPVFRNQRDCFNSLPPELLEEIRVLLPSNDVVKLHLASRSFAALPLAQYFWASRFRRGFERSHIFEPKISELGVGGLKSRRDWKSLYLKTSIREFPSNALENRIRVWNCVRPLADLVVSIPAVDDAAVRDFENVNTETGGSDTTPGWRCVGGNFRATRSGLPSSMACNVRFEQNVSVPETLTQIAVSLLYFRNRQYISGFRLISHGVPDVQLGYILPGNEAVLDVVGRDDDRGSLAGFICALSARGVQDLRVVTSKGQLSEWAGSSFGLSQTLRLCLEQPVRELRATFDGFKMVGLGVPDVSTYDAAPESGERSLSLRSRAIWFPSIPPENVYLHDYYYAGRFVSSAEYLRVVHTVFGGPRGIHLKHLTQLSAVCSHNAIIGLEFSYESDNSPIRREVLHSLMISKDLNRINFSINGPAGELLTQVQVGYGYRRSKNVIGGPYQAVEITSLVLETNQDRKFTIKPGVLPVFGPHGKTMKPPPGMAITGFYGMDDHLLGMCDLGVISESLPTDEEVESEGT